MTVNSLSIVRYPTAVTAPVPEAPAGASEVSVAQLPITRGNGMAALLSNGWLTICQNAVSLAESQIDNILWSDAFWPVGGLIWTNIQTYLADSLGTFTNDQLAALQQMAGAIQSGTQGLILPPQLIISIVTRKQFFGAVAVKGDLNTLTTAVAAISDHNDPAWIEFYSAVTLESDGPLATLTATTYGWNTAQMNELFAYAKGLTP